MAELSIKLRIGNREYPMRVKAEDEERIRLAGKVLNEKMKTYREKFGIEEYQDLLAMVAFDCQVERMKSEENKQSTDEYSLMQIQNLSKLISDSL
ncbi:MAG: cell division protein ZapA [Cyclobacteriaceae bacterium]|nr:cell division protein ZapA [Cyclobacteriaceae bacterium]